MLLLLRNDLSSVLGNINVQSVPGHIQDLRALIDKYSFDVLGISETFLKHHIIDQLISIPGYNLMRNDHLGKECGGVCAYVRDGIKAKLIDSSPGLYDGKPENIIIEIGGTIGIPAVLIGVIYRAPRLHIPNEFWNTWARLAQFYSHSVVMGDLNINLLNESSKDSRHLHAQADNLNMFIVPFGPTHHTILSHTWIDHILISKQSRISSFSQIPASLSGHDLLMTNIHIENPKPGSRKISFRDFSGFEVNSYLQDLASCDWDTLIQTQWSLKSTSLIKLLLKP